MNIIGTIHTWNRVRQTRKELNNLSSHQLFDLGIERNNIDMIARRAARG